MVRAFEDIGIATKSFDSIMPSVRPFEEIGEKEITGFTRGFLQYPEEKLPVIGETVKAARYLQGLGAFQRLQEGYDYAVPISPETMMPGAMGIKPALYTTRKQDIEDVENFLIRLEEEYTITGQAGRIMSEMPSFVFDFLITGGAFKAGMTGGKVAATKLLGRYAATTAGKAAIATTGAAVGIGLKSTAMPTRAVNAIMRRQAPEHIDVKSDGTVDIIGPVEKPWTSVYKGLADHYIEIASEMAGEFIAPGISKYIRKTPFLGKALSRIQTRWLKLNPGKKAQDFLKAVGTKTGFHGVLGEVGEEYLGDITRAITDVEHFGAGEDAGILERVGAAVRTDTENLPAMLIAFSVPGVVTAKVSSNLQKQKDINDAFRRQVQFVTGLEINTPTQIVTAEGMLGYEADFLMEKYEALKPKYNFDKPGVFKYFTPKWLLNRLLGFEIMLEDVTAAETSLQLEQQHLNGWVSKLIPKLKKEKGLARLPKLLPEIAKREAAEFAPEVEYVEELAEVAGGIIRPEAVPEPTKAHILQKKIGTDTNPIHIMRDLVDTYEDAPSFLNENETRIFNQIRELTRYLRQRANLVREKMGVEPIADVKGYITHWIDRIANSVVRKDLPIHSGYLYKLMKGLPKEVKNPTAMKRKIKQDMQNYFSKDLGKLLRTMTAFDLKDIYLKQPYEAVWDELQELRKQRLIPDSTYKEAENYLLYDIRKHQAYMDKQFNRTMRKPADFLAKLLSIKKSIDDPARSLFPFMRRLGIISGLGLRLKPGGRNLGQRLLLTDLYRTVDYAKAQAVAFRLAKMPVIDHPITGEPIEIMNLIRQQDWYQLSLRKFEDVITTITGIERAGLFWYSKTHVGNLFLSNVEVAALTGYFDWQQMRNKSKDTKSTHFKNIIHQAKKLGVPPSELLTQDSDMMWNIREAVRRTQWEYFNISMPTIYRSQFNRAMFMFQSWWMNYFFNHSREMINQSVTGRNSLGRLLTPGGRLRAAKGLGTIVAIGKAAKTLIGVEMIKYLVAPLPRYLPPIPELIIGLIQFFAADDEKERKRAWKRIQYGLKFWIPFSAFARDLNKLLSGEYSIGDFLFYRSEEKSK